MTLDHTYSVHPPILRRDSNVRPSGLRAFSLIEVMIAMVILGLGMVMAATIFPVAWQRARELTEYTVRQSALPAAELSVESLVSASGPSFTAVGFAGDLIYDADYYLTGGAIITPSDTRVHALNLENIQVEQSQFVPENPWSMEYAVNLVDLLNTDGELSPGPDKTNPLDPDILIDRTYMKPQIAFHQRVQPPMPTRVISQSSGLFSNLDTPSNWNDTLTSRKYAWGILHRLRIYVGPNPNEIMTNEEAIALAQQQIGSTRSFEMYYVLLRKPQPTLRYALQDPTTAPMPDQFSGTLQFVPAALTGQYDVMFPVAWRVELQFNNSLKNRPDPSNPNVNVSGIPTEINIPPAGFGGTSDARASLVQMFPKDAQFIDELTGEVFRVASRRLIGFDGDPTFQSVLTLDREVFIEDLDLETTSACNACAFDGVARPEELLRTVWIYPPPADPRSQGNVFPTFSGTQPVVSIDVRNASIPASE